MRLCVHPLHMNGEYKTIRVVVGALANDKILSNAYNLGFILVSLQQVAEVSTILLGLQQTRNIETAPTLFLRQGACVAVLHSHHNKPSQKHGRARSKQPIAVEASLGQVAAILDLGKALRHVLEKDRGKKKEKKNKKWPQPARLKVGIPPQVATTAQGVVRSALNPAEPPREERAHVWVYLRRGHVLPELDSTAHLRTLP